MKPVPKDILDKKDHEILMLSIENPDCFGYLIDRYEEPFLRKITAILRDEEKARDIVQDTFVKIYVHAKKYTIQEGASFKSWAYKILLNTCFTYCKKIKREKEFVALLDQDSLSMFGGGNDEYEHKLTLDHFKVVVSKIPVLLARVLTLTVLEGKTQGQIAEMEGISESAVRVRLHRAKKEFKKVDGTMSQYEQ